MDVKKRFGATTALYVKLRYMPNETDPLCTIEPVERYDIWYGGLTLYAKQGVSEEELYIKVTEILSLGGMIPEAIEFKRLSLEQIYIGVNSGALIPSLEPRRE